MISFKIKSISNLLVYKLIRPHCGGHGIHSPFLYQFVRQVLYNKDADKSARKEMQNLSGGYKPRYGRLFYKMAKYFQPQTIIVLDANTVAAYFKAGAPNADIIEISAKDSHNDPLRNGLSVMEKFDILYVGSSAQAEDIRSLFAKYLFYSHNNSIIIIDNIRTNESGWKAWQEICRNEKVSLSLDMFSIGLIFFNEKLKKQHFRLYY